MADKDKLEEQKRRAQQGPSQKKKINYSNKVKDQKKQVQEIYLERKKKILLQ